MSTTGQSRRGRGFQQTGRLLESRIRAVGESRGFAVSRLLTQWDDVVGVEISRIARPVDVTYGRKGLGATLTLLTTGAFAPILQAQLPMLQERVNACYGYKAISRIRITQSSATGFAEAQAIFQDRPADPPTSGPTRSKAADALAEEVENDALREALALLGSRILMSQKT